jgi:hypothetical protein
MGLWNLIWASRGGRGDNWNAIRKESFHIACYRFNQVIRSEMGKYPAEAHAISVLRRLFFSYYYAAHLCLQYAFLKDGARFQKYLRQAMGLTSIGYNNLICGLHSSGIVSDGTGNEKAYQVAMALLNWARIVYDRPVEYTQGWLAILNEAVAGQAEVAPRLHRQRYNEIASLLRLDGDVIQEAASWSELEYEIRGAAYKVCMDKEFVEIIDKELELHQQR